MDKLTNLKPHLITHPISLIALGIVAVLILAASWFVLPPELVIFLIILVVVGVAVGIWVLIKHPELRMEDEVLSNYLTNEFRNFSADVSQSQSPQVEEREDTRAAASEDLDDLRIKEYTENRGLFLVHAWRPSEKRGQVADIIIRLREHRETSTRPSLLAEGKVESVRYELGRRFFEEPFIKRNSEDNFALEVSAYRPMLCLAEVTFNDGHPPIRLSRYIDFPTGS